MYYHNGFKEICIDSINSMKNFCLGFRTLYWYVVLNINNNRRIFIDVLLYSEAEALLYTMNDLIKERL